MGIPGVVLGYQNLLLSLDSAQVLFTPSLGLRGGRQASTNPRPPSWMEVSPALDRCPDTYQTHTRHILRKPRGLHFARDGTSRANTHENLMNFLMMFMARQSWNKLYYACTTGANLKPGAGREDPRCTCLYGWPIAVQEFCGCGDVIFNLA